MCEASRIKQPRRPRRGNQLRCCPGRRPSIGLVGTSETAPRAQSSACPPSPSSRWYRQLLLPHPLGCVPPKKILGDDTFQPTRPYLPRSVIWLRFGPRPTYPGLRFCCASLLFYRPGGRPRGLACSCFGWVAKPIKSGGAGIADITLCGAAQAAQAVCRSNDNRACASCVPCSGRPGRAKKNAECSCTCLGLLFCCASLSWQPTYLGLFFCCAFNLLSPGLEKKTQPSGMASGSIGLH